MKAQEFVEKICAVLTDHKAEDVLSIDVRVVATLSLLCSRSESCQQPQRSLLPQNFRLCRVYALAALQLFGYLLYCHSISVLCDRDIPQLWHRLYSATILPTAVEVFHLWQTPRIRD